MNDQPLYLYALKGGGGGVHPVFFDFEIAVDQQTKAHDETFEGVPDSGCPPVQGIFQNLAANFF